MAPQWCHNCPKSSKCQSIGHFAYFSPHRRIHPTICLSFVTKYSFEFSTDRASDDSDTVDNRRSSKMRQFSWAAKEETWSWSRHVPNNCKCFALGLLYLLGQECGRARRAILLLWRRVVEHSEPSLAAAHYVLPFPRFSVLGGHLAAQLWARRIRSLTDLSDLQRTSVNCPEAPIYDGCSNLIYKSWFIYKIHLPSSKLTAANWCCE